jgi:hypothetical protein
MATISKAALVRLLGGFHLPDPDGPDIDPRGPIGPIARATQGSAFFPSPDGPDFDPRGPIGPIAHVGDESSLNPKPLPPRSIDAALAARAAISHAFEQYEAAGIIIVGGDTERAVEAARAKLDRFIDGICPDPPRPPVPWPWPWGPTLDREALDPVVLLAAGAQFQRMADTIGDHPLHDVFEQSADRLFDAGLDRLEPAAAPVASSY